MTSQTFDSINEQLQKTFLGPARDFTAATLDHVEKLAAIQYEAARAYTDLGVQQARSALQIRDAAGFQSYVADQQKLAETVGKRVKGDADQIAALSKDFVQKAQQTAQASAAAAQAK